MSETISPTFTFVKDGVFYFSRRIPKELRRHYTSPRIAYSLRTRSAKVADARARKAADQLDEYWFHLRSKDAQFPGKHMLLDGRSAGGDASLSQTVSVSSFVKLSEAVTLYLEQKGQGRPATFQRAAERACGYVIDACGDKHLDVYTKADANTFRDALIARGLAGSSLTRVFGTVRAVTNFAASEQGLPLNNPFAGVYYDRDAGVADRNAVPVDALRLIQGRCREIDDDLRWLVDLVSDTGLRLAEAAGLSRDDFVTHADGSIVVRVQQHPWRRLKTKGSGRDIPLEGAALWAAQRILASPTWSKHAFPRYNKAETTNASGSKAQLVQKPIEKLKGNRTSDQTLPLTIKTMQNLLDCFEVRGHHPSSVQIEALRDVVSTLEKMGQGRLKRSVYLSSLDPGVGKTSAVTEFIKQLLASEDHNEVGVLVCVGRLEEVRRLINDLGLSSSAIGVLTSDPELNSLGTVRHDYARIMITTHAMVETRCQDQTFAETSCFHFCSEPRQIRVWDEAMLRGEAISINTDQLGSLPELFRRTCPALADFAVNLAEKLLEADRGSAFQMPDVAGRLGLELSQIRSKCDAIQLDRGGPILDVLYQLSGQVVRLTGDNGRITTALNIRDARPADLAPVLVLDASGRVRHTYQVWEKGPQGLTRLRSAHKDYSNLSIKVMDKGGGIASWNSSGDAYVAEVAARINSKPSCEWLVIYPSRAMGGRFPQTLRRLIETEPQRVKVVNWGAHQGRNDFGHIQNVILAGTLFYPQHHYEGLAYLSSGIPVAPPLPPALLKSITLGERKDLILQGLCRASVRGSVGDKCRPCNAYVIASKASGIRSALPTIFPGCRVSNWTSLPSKARGKVREAIAILKAFKREHPEGVLLFSDMMAKLGINNRANFNRTIRNHKQFTETMEELDASEVMSGGGRHRNAFSFTFGPLSEASYRPEV